MDFSGLYDPFIYAIIILIIVSIAGCLGSSYFFYKKGQQHPLGNISIVIETNQVVTTNYIVNGKAK